MTLYAYLNAFLSNWLSFVVGASISWSSPEIIKFNTSDESPFDHLLTDDELSWITSLLSVGGIVGTFPFAIMANSIGRKWTLLIISLIYIISYAIMAFGRIVELFYVARFLIGIAGHAAVAIVSTFLGEIAKNSNRGLLGVSLSCFFCLGVLFSLITGPYLSVSVFNGVLTAIPSVFFIVMCFFGTETPQFLILKGDKQNAQTALAKLKGKSIDFNNEIQELETNIKSTENVNIFKAIKNSMKPVIISMLLVVFQQTSGVPGIFFYAEYIFNLAKTNLDSSVCAIIIGITHFVSTLIVPIIIEKVGRRALMIISSCGTMTMHGLLGIFFILREYGIYLDDLSIFPLVCLILCIVFYNFGFGALPFVIAVELCPPALRSIVTSSMSVLSAVVGFILTKFFYDLEKSIGIAGIFLCFSCFCALSTIFTVMFLIETKGKSFLNIQKELMN